jgi:lysophospholipase L1-like esterase
MKKRIMAIVSMILCITSLLSCVGCSEDIGDESDTLLSSATDYNLGTFETETEMPTEAPETEKKTTSKNTTKRTTVKASDENLIPGKSTTTNALNAKTYNFANMSTTDQSLFKFVGRVKPCASGLIFDNSCATLEFQGYMTGDVVLEIYSEQNEGYGYGFSYFTVYVDGKRVDTRFKVDEKKTAKLTVASFTGKYFHTVKIVKQTEFKWSKATIKSLSFTGYLTKAPAKDKYYIEFLGDSLTAAYGNIGKPGNEPSDSPKYQDGTKSYAYIAAESLGADYSMISRSSVGLSKCWSNAPVIDYYKAYSKGRGSEAFNPKNERKPDLIVLHLGANDYNMGGSNKTNFVSKGKELVDYLRSSYGTNVPIIWAYDPKEGFPDKVKEIMNSYGGEAKGYYTLSLGWSEAGAGSHPSANEHAKHAKLLTDLVKNKNILK